MMKVPTSKLTLGLIKDYSAKNQKKKANPEGWPEFFDVTELIYLFTHIIIVPDFQLFKNT